MDEGWNDTDVNLLVRAERAVHVLPAVGEDCMVKERMDTGATWNLQCTIADLDHDKVGVFWGTLHRLLDKRLRYID